MWHTKQGGVSVNPEVAFYYPGQYWRNVDWAKNLVLFFDGVAMLIPEYMSDHSSFDDLPVIAALKSHDLFHVIRPEASVGQKEAEALAGALVDVITSGTLDHLISAADADVRASSFGSLSMSRLGYRGDRELAEFVVNELKARGLAADSEDGMSIPMHRTVRALILVLLSQILRSRGKDMNLRLSPATDQPRLVASLGEILLGESASSSSFGDVVSLDMAKVGVDLASVPMDEVLDFRAQHYSEHRKYILSVRRFTNELSLMDIEHRAAAFEERQEEIDDVARSLTRANWRAWRRPASFAMTLAGAGLTGATGNPLLAALIAAGALLGYENTDRNDVGVYSYLFSAQDSLF